MILSAWSSDRSGKLMTASATRRYSSKSRSISSTSDEGASLNSVKFFDVYAAHSACATEAKPATSAAGTMRRSLSNIARTTPASLHGVTLDTERQRADALAGRREDRVRDRRRGRRERGLAAARRVV